MVKSFSDFSEAKVAVEILDGDVIEIDASNVKNEVEVRIASVSNNINRKYIGKSLSFKASIKILSQILLLIIDFFILLSCLTPFILI